MTAFEARNLPPEYQRRLALMALAGWTFHRRENFHVARWRVVSPEGEGFIYCTLRDAVILETIA